MFLYDDYDAYEHANGLNGLNFWRYEFMNIWGYIVWSMILIIVVVGWLDWVGLRGFTWSLHLLTLWEFMICYLTLLFMWLFLFMLAMILLGDRVYDIIGSSVLVYIWLP